MLATKLFFVVVCSIGINAQNEYKKPFKLSCVTSPVQKEFKFFWLNDNIDANLRQRDLQIEFGKKSSFLFHFLGFGDSIRMDRPGENFYLARGIVQEADPGQVVCYVDYAYGNDATIVQMMEYYNGIRMRVPFVINALTKFISKLAEFKFINSADQITATGFCLGGHMAGMLGRKLNDLYKNQIRMVLAFDPPKYGFESHDFMYRERVQKGDAKYVEVTHTSFMGMYTNDADTDVILNDLRQPGCPHQIIDLFCNHVAALTFHEHIFNRTKPAPFYASLDKNRPENGDVLLGFWNTDFNPKGVVYLKTKDFFGGEEKSVIQHLMDKVVGKKRCV